MTFSTRKVLFGFNGIAEDASILSYRCHHMDGPAAAPGMLDSEGYVSGISGTGWAYDNWSLGQTGKWAEAIVRALSGPPGGGKQKPAFSIEERGLFVSMHVVRERESHRSGRRAGRRMSSLLPRRLEWETAQLRRLAASQ
jgi:hypothetical protein